VSHLVFVILNVSVLSAIILTVVMKSVIMLSVMAPIYHGWYIISADISFQNVPKLPMLVVAGGYSKVVEHLTLNLSSRV
jgi:hypothetical protein